MRLVGRLGNKFTLARFIFKTRENLNMPNFRLDGIPFENLISVDSSDFASCINMLEFTEELEGKNVEIRFHFLKLTANGEPAVKLLAEVLYNYILQYCIAQKNRPEPLNPVQVMKLAKEARSLFRHPLISDDSPDKTGEAGEALLFFLIEAVLKAPQVVSKMELKTNHKDEVKGSDGIHMRWNEAEQVVELFFGEAKLYQDLQAALRSALKSIDGFHESEMYKHEFAMVTKHFKFADKEVQSEVRKLLRYGEPSEDVKIKHACLIGYDWDGYSRLSANKVGEKRRELVELLNEEAVRLTDALDNKFEGFERKYLEFDFFFLPFPSVVDFRNAFNAALD